MSETIGVGDTVSVLGKEMVVEYVGFLKRKGHEERTIGAQWLDVDGKPSRADFMLSDVKLVKKADVVR